ncbi:hypothetical protein [Devosia sp. 2618]|uniref:hypothetical protein n=1 Tax=Devosia sp. 2618 TaxID=3156454 RepID=UPI0033924966
MSCVATSIVQSQEPAAFPHDFRTLGIGQNAADITTEGYDRFACGDNGNLPLQALSNWSEYAKCKPDENGLHEVVVEFGNSTERMSQLFHEQYNEELWLQPFGGTRLANFPVVLSLLFDDEGVSRGFRAVTDSRAEMRDRNRAYLLRFRVFSHYGPEEWNCDSFEPRFGRTPVGSNYVDEICTKTVDGKFIRVEGHAFRKPGQTGVDIAGHFLPGQFESSTRWEAWDASYLAAREND